MDTLKLDRSSLAITQRCTLKCKLCNAYIPYYKKPIDMPLNQIARVLERYFSIVDSVGIFGILGGEPLLHPDIVKILNAVKNYSERITERIDIVTNGTIMFTDELLAFFVENSPKTKVIISHYGQYSPKADMLIDKLTELGINYRAAKYYGDDLLYGGWLDFRDHSQKHFSPEAVARQAEGCIVSRNRYYLISEGEMHTCTRAHWRMREGIIPRNREEYLDLLDPKADLESQKITLTKLETRASTTSCAYCHGSNDSHLRYTPAEQL